jgi:signal transduction histidine kinase
VFRIGPENGLPAAPVSAVHQTADQFLWFTTSAGLTRFDGLRLVTVAATAFATNSNQPFEAVGIGGPGGSELWFATREALFQNSAGGFRPVGFDDPADAAHFLGLAPRQAGGRDVRFAGPLWVGTERGVYELYKGMLRPVWKARSEPAWHIAEGANGVGVGTTNGVWLYRPAEGTWTQLASLDSAKSGCPPVVASEGGMLWQASAVGAAQQVGSERPKLVPLRGVTPGCYRWAGSDRAGNRWLVEASSGLLRRDTNGVEVIHGTSPADLGEIRAATLDSLGRVWLGTARGLACVAPKNSPAPEPPLVLLQRLLWAGETVNLEASPDQPLRRAAKNLGDVRIEFLAPLRLPSDGVRFAHRLARSGGEAWVEADLPQATFADLRPGGYVFQVRAASARGAWGPLTTLRMEVEPDFFGSTGFRVLLAVVGSGVLAASAWWRFRWRQRSQPNPGNALVSSERERIARDLHDDIGAQLAALALQVELIRRRANPEITQDLDQLAARARDAVARMNDIVWALNPACDTVASFGHHWAGHAEHWSQLTGTRFKVEIPPDLPALPMSAVARRHLAMVIREALNNVAKHAQATETRLLLRIGPADLFLSVQDNGKGFDPATNEAAPVGTSRNGLRNQKSRLAEMGGKVELRGRYGGGTRLDVTVPLSALGEAGA